MDFAIRLVNSVFKLPDGLAGCKENHFTACHSGKLNLAFTSPQVISTGPKAKAFWWVELISQFFCYSDSSKNITCPLGKLKTEFTSQIAKSTSPGLSDTTFFARWASDLFFGVFKLKKNCSQFCSSKLFWGLVKMTLVLVHVSYSLPEVQALKMILFAPWTQEFLRWNQ